MSLFEQRIDRRRFLAGSATVGMGLALPTVAVRQASAYALSTFGTGELHIVSDGHLSLPRSFSFPDSIDSAELEALLRRYDLDTTTLTPDCNLTLWHNDDRLVLFDVGSGPNFMSTTGQLLDNLAELDIDPADVTDVVFTHAHPDHLWGLLDDFDELICPNATYHMSSVEWDYWRADDTLDKTPEARKTFVVGAQNRFPSIEDRIQLFSPGQEILPGVEAIDTRGHTPGHTSFALHAGDSSMVVVGDALTNVAVSFEKPSWRSGADQDQDQGVATRLALLDRLAAEQSTIIGFHLPHPGMGQVARQGNAYRFVVE
ncbi:MAG: MBL fold metallo-hydrolase [Granulosicoccus sp.]|nr:MBL fold metallo-hydrolase [Granulosicoccus sp.]